MLSNSLLKFAATHDWNTCNGDEYVFGDVNGYTFTAKTDDILTSFFFSVAGIAPENLIEFATWLESKRFPLTVIDYEMTDNFMAIRVKDTAFSGTARQMHQFLQTLTERLKSLEVDPEACAICGLPADQKALYVGLYCHVHEDCIETEGVDFTAAYNDDAADDEDEELVLLDDEGFHADDVGVVGEARLAAMAAAFDDDREAFLEDLGQLCAIPSVNGPAEDDAPFGIEPKRALDHFLAMGERMGFRVQNVDNVAGYVEMGEGDEMVACVCHLDVVPAGSGWDSDPFLMEIVNDTVIARGVNDDKGPAVAALYAMKALKDDPTFRPKRRIRLIVGTNEELGSRCMTRYRETEEIPVAGFTADAVFPAIYAEKGIVTVTLSLPRAEDDAILEAHAGDAANMVPGLCVVTLKDGTERESHGDIAHGSTPELGHNAISEALDGLFDGEDDADDTDAHDAFVTFYNDVIGWELDGRSLGIAYDDATGATTVNAGILNIDDATASVTLNIRYPVTMEYADLQASLEAHVEPYGVDVDWVSHQPPLHIERNSPLIETLMEVYRDLTETDGEAIATGGGTYARALPNICAFGPAFPEDPDVAHQANEWASIDGLLAGAALYREALRRLAGDATEPSDA